MATSMEMEADNAYESVGDGPYESPGGAIYDNEPPGGKAYVNESPPMYDTLSLAEVKLSNAPSRRVYWYAAGLSLAVAAVFGIVTGVTLHLLASAGGGDGGGGDGWGAWGPWGPCDVTCGGGWMSRSRECLQDTCIGSTTQVQECAKEPCPAPELPVWSSWGAWSECSVTCGDGTQTRDRTCPGDSGAEGCSGDGTQSRPCPGWSCPNCSEPCAGDWNPSCTWCACAGDVLTGLVLTPHNTPLANVTVSPAHAPYVTLAVTGTQGSFSVADVCVGQRLLFTNPPRYLDTEAEVTSVAVPMLITMQGDVVALSINTPPESAVRLVGESVTLCCSATGSPPPAYYEWFHNEKVIMTDWTAAQSVLVLQDLQEAQAGDYRCRANNDYNTIYSEPATLQVKVSEEASCPSAPLPYMQQLPYGCKTAGGALAMDVGTCSRDPCRAAGQNITNTCERGDNFCCAPVEFNRVSLVCDEYSDFMYVVVRCACVRCQEDNQVVSGQALAADTLAPVPYAEVQLHEGPSVFADAQGRFVLPLPEPRHRIALTVSDVMSSDLVQTNKVLYSGNFESESGVIIKLLRKAAPVTVNTSEETFLPMGLGAGGAGAFAGISIPPGSVFTDAGAVFTGEAEARLSVIDPRQLEDIENAPSDFSYVDEEGNGQMLDTFGMFNLQMEDASGNSLHVQGYIEVSLDAELAGEVLPNLYTLQGDGKWHEEGSMHTEQVAKKSVKSKYFKTSVVVGGVEVPVTDEWISLSFPSPTSSCVSKVRLYKNNVYRESIEWAMPYVVIIRSPIYQRYSQVLHEGTGRGYCIVHPCDVTLNSGTRGYVLIENGGKRAFPVSDDNIDANGIDAQVKARINARSDIDAIRTDLSFFTQQSSRGPFYRYSYSTSVDCRDAGETDNHFRFHMEELSASCVETVDYKRLEFPEFIVDDINYYTWYTKDLVMSEDSHSAVYIKVITQGVFPVDIEATSMVGNNTQGTVRVGDRYGSLYQCTENVPAVCLELKPSGDVSNGFFQPFFRDDTFIRVQTQADSRHLCSGYAISPELNRYVNHPTPDFVASHKFELGMSERFEQQEIKLFAQGVYWYKGDSQEALSTVKQRAYDACRTGADPDFEVKDEPTNTANYALKFYCP